MHTVRIATNPRKWRRPAPCPACRKSRPLILTLGTIYKLRTRKPVNTIYGCICPNCRHKCILHVDGRSLKKSHPPLEPPRQPSKERTMRNTICATLTAITLTDTRKVDCVVYSGYKQGGLSCDWSHVSVVGKEPAR